MEVGDHSAGETVTASEYASADNGQVQATEPERGDELDRYIVIERIGAGGMGAVFRAYDPELDRGVAIKVVLEERMLRTAERQRILREARTTAKLSHANVVAVYDVGEYAGGVFIVMELIRGVTLKEWAEDGERPPEEIVGMYRQAGAGLLAAHEAGLVHRDIKPSNILIGDDGRVCVADFGLARAESSEPSDHVEEVREISPSALAPSRTHTITRAGFVVGSPAYMAPEQFEDSADARSDQFSFCMSLHESLTGKRLQRREDNSVILSDGELEKIPTRLRGTIRRGLSSDPDLRFPSMVELLKALAPKAVSPRRWAIGLFAATLCLAIAAFAMKGSEPEQPCVGVGSEWSKVWNPAIASAVEGAFLDTSLSHASDAFKRVSNSLGDYGDTWIETRRASCRATFVEQRASSEVFDARQACLERRLDEVSALVGVWRDSPNINRAVTGVSKLSPLSQCDAQPALDALAGVPTEPQKRIAFDEIERRIDGIKALEVAGKYEEAVQIGVAVVSDAERLDIARTSARAKRWLAEAESRLGNYERAITLCDESIVAAASAGQTRIEASCWLLNRWITAEFVRDLPAAESLTFATTLSVTRAHDDLELLGRLEGQNGTLADRQGNFAASEKHYLRSLALYERRFGPDDHRVGIALNNLGNIYSLQGKHEASIQSFERSLEVKEKALGKHHPSVAHSLNNFGRVLRRLGKSEQALENYRRALEIRKIALGPEHRYVATSLASIASVLQAQGKYVESLALREEALAIQQKVFGRDNAIIAMNLNNHGMLLYDMGRLGEGRKLLERALRIRKDKLGERHYRVADTLDNLGIVAWDEGKRAESIRYFEEALEIYLATENLDRQKIASVRISLASAHWKQNDRRKAWALAQLARDDVEDGTASDQETVRKWLEVHPEP